MSVITLFNILMRVYIHRRFYLIRQVYWCVLLLSWQFKRSDDRLGVDKSLERCKKAVGSYPKSLLKANEKNHGYGMVMPQVCFAKG